MLKDFINTLKASIALFGKKSTGKNKLRFKTMWKGKGNLASLGHFFKGYFDRKARLKA